MEPGAKEREVSAPANRALAQALEHPLRARIAAELEKRSMDRQELAEVLGEPLPLVKYHYDVLTAVGLARGA
jgi:DNA-binding transcriptional ArsR family regulator